MTIGTIKVNVSIRHMWLIKLINYPRVALGFDVYVPSFCVKVG